MPNQHIDVNTPKTISLSTGAGISQNLSTRRAVALSVEPVNKRFSLPLYIH